jgi:type IV secretory pathway VirB9-like protein
MLNGRWMILLLPALCGCAGPSWVPQPSHRPMAELDHPADEGSTPAPVDTVETLMTMTTSSVPAKAAGQVVGATLIYPKNRASTYPIATKVHHTTTVIFPMGERLTGDIIGGKEQIKYQPFPDAEPQSAPGWVISHGSSGDGDATHLQVDITPNQTGLVSTIVVRTTGGWYVLDVNSRGKGYYPMVAFWQPNPSTPQARREGFVVPVNGALGLGYEILTPDTRVPSWTPKAVWDDQALTVFQFGRGLAQGEAPELYSVNERGERMLVNHTPKGTRYLVAHRLSSAWELKLGEVVVRVRQKPDYAVVSCPRDAGCPVHAAVPQ